MTDHSAPEPLFTLFHPMQGFLVSAKEEAGTWTMQWGKQLIQAKALTSAEADDITLRSGIGALIKNPYPTVATAEAGQRVPAPPPSARIVQAPAPRPLEYSIINGGEDDFFVTYVNEAMADGWRPLGGLATCVIDGKAKFHQAFVREKRPEAAS